MSDDLERRLRIRLGGPLPAATKSLIDRLERVPIEHARRRATGPSRDMIAATAAAVILAVGLLWILVPGQGPAAPLGASPTVAGPEPSSTATRPPSPTPTASASASARDTWTVSEFLSRREAGTLPDGPITLQGYWTDRSFPHSCPAPLPNQAGDLVIWCREGEYGITESDEPILTLLRDGRVVRAVGPWMTPYIDVEEALPLVSQPSINGQPFPPVPIVVVGHVRDPRAEACGSEALQVCRDRFVVDEILVFDPQAVATPAPTLPPTPFPFEDPPPAPFTAALCSGEVPYSFVGWAKLSDFGMDAGDPDAIHYLMVTRDAVDLGEPGGPVGRRACYAREWERDSVTYSQLP